MHISGVGKRDLHVFRHAKLQDIGFTCAHHISNLLQYPKVAFIVLISHLMCFFFIYRATMRCRTPNTIATWSSMTILPMVLEGSDAVISLCIVKVLTVQVVLCNTYCSGGTYSNTLTLMCRASDVTCHFEVLSLC